MFATQNQIWIIKFGSQSSALRLARTYMRSRNKMVCGENSNRLKRVFVTQVSYGTKKTRSLERVTAIAEAGKNVFIAQLLG